MTRLYTHKETQTLKKKAAKVRAVMALLPAVAFIACVVLCMCMRTDNEYTLLYVIIALSTLAGWADILLWVFSYHPADATSKHMQGILEGEETLHSGVIGKPGMLFAIPKSIEIYKVSLTDAEGEKETMNILRGKEKLLPPAGTYVTVTAVRSYITGVETSGETGAETDAETNGEAEA